MTEFKAGDKVIASIGGAELEGVVGYSYTHDKRIDIMLVDEQVIVANTENVRHAPHVWAVGDLVNGVEDAKSLPIGSVIMYAIHQDDNVDNVVWLKTDVDTFEFTGSEDPCTSSEFYFTRVVLYVPN